MKKIKNVIIILIILIVVTLISITILNISQKDKTETSKNTQNIGDIGDEPEITGREEEVTDTTTIATVESCIEQYYNVINNNSSLYYARGEESYEKILNDEEINQNIIKLLSDEYITKNSINTSNLDEYIKKIDENANVIALKMKVLIDNPIEKYAVYGKVVNLEYKLIEEFYMYVNLDVMGKTFSIEPINNINNFDEIEITNNNTSIEAKDINTYQDANLGYEEIIEESMNRFKILSFSDIESSYKYLDEEYRSKRFSNINKYKEYIELNRNDIEQADIEKYKTKYYNGHIEYTCIDQYGNYYIFSEKNIMDFTLKLDTYTIDTEEFKTKYEDYSEEEKLQANIEKIFQALNRKDYEYIYNKLNLEYKQNNFATLPEFGNYIKNNYFNINKIEEGTFRSAENGYICYITVEDGNQKDEPIDKKINISIEEEQNFIINNI